jgi:hypothetical protein
VDALDISAAMVAEGRTRPGGEAPNLRWIVGAAAGGTLETLIVARLTWGRILAGPC